jgi:hypothetical protein
MATARAALLFPALLAAIEVLSPPLPGQNCTVTSVGRTPLDDPAGGSYLGQLLGLWPAGANVPPAAHRAAGLAAAAAVTPRDAAGAPSPTGRIVLLSIGMSNTTQEFSTWLPIGNADPARNPAVVAVDGAQGGQDAPIVADPTSPFWNVVASRLAAAGVTAQQVQAVWLKEAVAGPTAAFPAHAQQLRDYLAQIARNLKTFYPNVRLCFVSSRIYAGYATSTLNPEPYAYESGFAVRWLLEQQIGGDPALNADPSSGTVVAPWLGWGPYLWADGTTPRATDGLVWNCGDYQNDGTHPGTAGRAKVAARLDAFWHQSEFATPWYLGSGAPHASFALFGSGCPGTAGVPQVAVQGLPVLGNATFRVGVTDAAPGRFALLLISAGSAFVPLSGSCVLLVDFAQSLPGPLLVTNGQGRAIATLPVPGDPALAGFQAFLQWGIDDPLGAPLAGVAGVALTGGAIATLGI